MALQRKKRSSRLMTRTPYLRYGPSLPHPCLTAVTSLHATTPGVNHRSHMSSQAALPARDVTTRICSAHKMRRRTCLHCVIVGLSMKTAIALLILFVFVVGGGYLYSTHNNPSAPAVSDSQIQATSTPVQATTTTKTPSRGTPSGG